MKIVMLSHRQEHLPGKPGLMLAAACELSPGGSLHRACVTDQLQDLQELAAQALSLDAIAVQLGVALLDFSGPLLLDPVYIAKPWGQEIWFTGIEARGVSRVVTASGSTPLDWALALAQTELLGQQHKTLNLLKILDPLPDEVYGDLYFELHEQKREVYVVTQIDEKAWPNGVGAIRFGFAADKRAQFASDEAFVQAYRDAVRAYQVVRRELDSLMDTLRLRDGIGLQSPVSVLQTRCWLAELPQDLQTREATLRAQMEAFTALRPLRVGDVLAVPLRTPHALQHGVRTVEFQTPVYERRILSFAQKVLTQDNWDTDEALQLACLQTPTDEPFPCLHQSETVTLECIVSFDDFVVERLYLAPGASWAVSTVAVYQLLMPVNGELLCGTLSLAAEQAALLPAIVDSCVLQNTGTSRLVCLLARPR